MLMLHALPTFACGESLGRSEKDWKINFPSFFSRLYHDLRQLGFNFAADKKKNMLSPDLKTGEQTKP